ncbi:MAG: hypothetical protein MK188_05845 [Gammaproteobacteria bacterium]|nr:hypothetical protein [Gammaproteobacteria bacterium]
MQIVKKTITNVFYHIFFRLDLQQLEKIQCKLLWYRLRLQELIRRKEATIKGDIKPPILLNKNQALNRSILDSNADWHTLDVSTCQIPGMLTKSEKQYYEYISQTYSGIGEVVELGPWLGASTKILLNGLAKNRSFDNKKLHVYDDFVWRDSWMEKWLQGTDIKPPGNYESFLPIFEEIHRQELSKLNITKAKIADYDGNESLEQIEWIGTPIEIMIVDCGRQLHVNEAWWQIFNSSFIPDRTLIVMQDWQNHKAVPEIYWENTKIFTDSKEGRLDLIHEVHNAGIATFIYRNH